MHTYKQHLAQFIIIDICSPVLTSTLCCTLVSLLDWDLSRYC